METLRKQINAIKNGFYEREYGPNGEAYYVDSYGRKVMIEYVVNIHRVWYVLNNESYEWNLVDGVEIIYNQYGKAVSILFGDGHEWLGESFISEEAISLENKFRVDYKNFMERYKVTRINKELYSEICDLLERVSNITCICDMSLITTTLSNMKRFGEIVLYGNPDIFCKNQLNIVKNMENELTKKNNEEKKSELYIEKLNKYYSWSKNLEKKFMEKYGPRNVYTRKTSYINSCILGCVDKGLVTEKDINVISSLVTELEVMIKADKDCEALVEPKKNQPVKVEMVDLSDVKEASDIRVEQVNLDEEEKPKKVSLFKKIKKKTIAVYAALLAGVISIGSVGGSLFAKHLKNASADNITIVNDDQEDLSLTSYGVPDKYLAGLDTRNIVKASTLDEAIVGLGSSNIVNTNTLDEAIAGLGAEDAIAETEAQTEAQTETTEVQTESLVQTESEAIKEENKEVVIENQTDRILAGLALKSARGVIEKEDTTDLVAVEDEKNLLESYKTELQNLKMMLPSSDLEIDGIRSIGDSVNIVSDATLKNDEYSLILDKNEKTSLYKDELPRVVASIVMSDGTSGKTAKTMEEALDLYNEGYNVAGYGLLNPYSTNEGNIEGFYEDEDVVGLVRK